MEKYYPEHCAIILDGNRRWAKRKGLPQLKGHQAGFENIKRLAPYIIDQGVKVLSVFAFSTIGFACILYKPSIPRLISSGTSGSDRGYTRFCQ